MAMDERVTVGGQIRYVHEFFEQALNIIRSKGVDYAPRGIAMSEVFWTAAESKQTPDQVIWTMMRKHLGAVRTHVSGQALKADSLDEHLRDIANFCAMLSWWTQKRALFLDALRKYVDTYECECLPGNSHDKCDRCVMGEWLWPRLVTEAQP